MKSIYQELKYPRKIIMALKHNSESSKGYHDTFSNVNEREVEDISLEFFYKPHTITLLAVSIAAVVYFSFIRSVK